MILGFNGSFCLVTTINMQITQLFLNYGSILMKFIINNKMCFTVYITMMDMDCTDLQIKAFFFFPSKRSSTENM